MATERSRQAALAALVVILAVAIYYALPGTSTAPASSSNQGRTAAGATAGSQSQPAAPDVHLVALEGERPKPVNTVRNLFRFKTKAAPPPSAMIARGTAPAAPVNPVPAVPPGPPAPPPITLKFIGIVEAPAKARKLAVLSDSAGHVFQGAEGDLVEGRYRIVRIGVESIEMSYLDGRGRQTIRLTGS
jgi:hypothetical protein